MSPYRTAPKEDPVPAPVMVELRVTLWLEGSRTTGRPNDWNVASALETLIEGERKDGLDLCGRRLLAEDVAPAQAAVEPTKVPSPGAHRT